MSALGQKRTSEVGFAMSALTIELAKPRGSFPGRVEIGHYCIADGAVVLTDENGKPIGAEKRHLNPGDDARLVACRLLRGRKRSEGRSAEFAAPIRYPRSKYL
jgi:hypothetical protein